MSKTRKIMYWIFTIWLGLGMTVSATLQLIRAEDVVVSIKSLGYPVYITSILGTWKLLGVVAILIPKYPIIKEWAYAGFFFLSTGAFISHVASHHPVQEMVGSLLLLVLTLLSWYLRPDNRKPVTLNQ